MPNSDLSKKLTRIALFGLFVSTACLFYFPLLFLYLREFGYSTTETALMISFTMACTSPAIAWADAELDRERFNRVFGFCALFLLLGLNAFLFREKLPHSIFIISCTLYVVSTAILYSIARRTTESLCDRSKEKAPSLSLAPQTLGLSVAAFVAWNFIEKYFVELIFLDATTSLLYLATLYFLNLKVRSRILSKKTSLAQTFSDFIELKHYFKSEWRFLLPVSILLISSFSVFSGIQLLLDQELLQPKKYAALMMAVNVFGVVGTTLWVSRPRIKWNADPKNFVIASSLIAFGMGALPFILNFWGIIFATLIWAAGMGLFIPILTARIIGFFDESNPGLAIGMKDLLYCFGFVFSPLLAIILDGLPKEFFSLAFGGLPILACFLFKFSSFREKEA